MIVVTGATGRTGRRVAETLLAKGEVVRALGRNAEKLESLEGLGAEVFVGNVGDVSYLDAAFAQATGVYLVLPEDLSQPDLRAHQDLVSDSFARAIANTNVEFVVNLSSIGAQHAKGTGPIAGLHDQEQRLNRLAGLNVLHLRAAYFMENLFMNLSPLLATGTLPGGMRGDVAIPWIATKDIGTYAANRLMARDFSGSSIQELHGQRDISMNEAALIVGKAIKENDVCYVQVPAALLESELLEMGLPEKTAKLIIEMWEGANAGLIAPQEWRSTGNTTPTSLESFVSESFVPAYLQAMTVER